MQAPQQGIDLPPQQQEALMAAVEQMQIRDRYVFTSAAYKPDGLTTHVPHYHSLRMYNTVVERCFMDCVGSFKRKDLEKDEEAVRRLLHTLDDRRPHQPIHSAYRSAPRNSSTSPGG